MSHVDVCADVSQRIINLELSNECLRNVIQGGPKEGIY